MHQSSGLTRRGDSDVVGELHEPSESSEVLITDGDAVVMGLVCWFDSEQVVAECPPRTITDPDANLTFVSYRSTDRLGTIQPRDDEFRGAEEAPSRLAVLCAACSPRLSDRAFNHSGFPRRTTRTPNDEFDSFTVVP